MKGAQRAPLLLAILNRGQRPLCRFERGDNRIHRRFVGDRVGDELRLAVFVLAIGNARGFAVDADEPGFEAFVGLAIRVELGFQRPVLDRN